MSENKLQPVSYDQAVKLKQHGFNWPVYHWYNSDGTLSNSIDAYERNTSGYSIAAPFTALALKWMRDEKKIICGVGCNGHGKYLLEYMAWIFTDGDSIGDFNTHDEAESTLLDILLITLKHETND